MTGGLTTGAVHDNDNRSLRGREGSRRDLPGEVHTRVYRMFATGEQAIWGHLINSTRTAGSRQSCGQAPQDRFSI